MSDITEKYGHMNIRELIKKFPGLVDVLEGYDIDCVNCEHGRCRLYDIPEGENLSMDEEMVNMVQFQSAYTAAAKLVSTVDEMLQALIAMV